MAKAPLDCETPEGLAGVSSSSSEFFTAREDSTLKSSSDEHTRPKSWDSSLLCQFPSSGSGSEYQTAVNPESSHSSSRSYLGNLSSEASGSGTLVASQIDLDSCMSEGEVEHAGPVTPKPTSRSVQVGQESPNLLESRLPVTLTSSNSGTTVCTQVETTYESRVQGDAEVDDQDGNTDIFDESESPVSFNEHQGQGLARQRKYLAETGFLSEDSPEISNLFLTQMSQESMGDIIPRPVTPEPHQIPSTNLLQFNEASQLEELFNIEYCTTGSGPYLESPAGDTQHKLEDIEEEGSLKNSPKSVLSLEMSGTSVDSNGDKVGRPISRESSSSLNEFERLESALLEEYEAKKDPLLSEIEEGHESQVSEESDETEICGEEPIECEMDFDWDTHANLEGGDTETPPRRPQHSSDNPPFTSH